MRLAAPFLLLLAACAGPGLLNAVARNPDRGTVAVRDLPYGEGERQVLDLYVPSGAGPHPLLMFVHGGGWEDGSKDVYAFAGKRFAAEGYLTAVPSYTLLPEGVYDVFMADMAAALAAAIEAAPDQGWDGEHVFLVGHSAGAYNVVQLALAPEFLAQEGLSTGVIDGVAGLSGPYDFLPLDPGVTTEAFGGAADLEATQPVRRVTPDAPPMLLLSGTEDTVVRPGNSERLAQALREAGVRAELVTLDGVDHAGPIVAVAFPNRLPVVPQVDAFFRSVMAGEES
jgi:acetyl esterase/lipase